MFVRNAMIPRPLVVGPETSLTDFVDAVLASNQTTAAVLDADEKLVGIVSLQDVCREILPAYVEQAPELGRAVHEGYFDEKFRELAARKVAEIMTTDVDTLGPDDTVISAVTVFAESSRKSIPVLADGKFVGTVTRRSVFNCVRRP